VHAGVWGKGEKKNRGNNTCVGAYPAFCVLKGPGKTAIPAQSCKWLESQWQKGRKAGKSHTCATPAFPEVRRHGMVCTLPL